MDQFLAILFQRIEFVLINLRPYFAGQSVRKYLGHLNY